MVSGDKKPAYSIVREHGQTNSANKSEAEWFARWIALRFLNNPEVAFYHFYEVFTDVRFPIGIGRSAYWCGRATDQMSYDFTAKAWYLEAHEDRETYYGQIAAHKISLNVTLDLRDTPTPTFQQIIEFRRNGLVRAVQVLMEVGQKRLVEAFLCQLVFLAEAPDEHELIARLAQGTGRTDLVVKAGK